MNIEYAIIVKNKTRLESLIERFNTKAQAKFYIERQGGDYNDYESEHEIFHQSLTQVERYLSQVLRHKIVERSFVPSFLFNQNHVVVVIGQDGLVANTAKYVNNIPIVAVNPESDRYDGVLLPFSPDNFVPAIESVIRGTYNKRIASFAEAQLNDGQRLLAFNDLFVGASSHVSARYRISYGRNSEEQSSSGIIISTQSGATGWLSSIFNMSYGIHNFIEKSNSTSRRAKLKDDQLLFAVREPFASKKTQTGLQAGVLQGQTRLTVQSYMPSNGVIFSDGIESDYLRFNSGTIATIGIANEKATLVLP
ncbi:MAG: sugar kinase [Bacteroidetes bacterium]|nr:sugar kinase [Bacteroidota bacterium]